MRRSVMAMVTGVLLFSLACTSVNMRLWTERAEVGELQHETRVVELARMEDLEEGDELRVVITMGAGELGIDGGAEELLEAEFAYNIAEWAPTVEYYNGRLTIAQPSSQRVPFNENVRYVWTLDFNTTVPMALRAELGAGTGTLDLGSLKVRTVDIKLGAGDVVVDLSGNRSLERLDMDMGAGSLDLDLRGEWQEDVSVNIRGGLGETTLHLPQHIGVRVRVDRGLGHVNVRGLQRDGNTYVNALYGESPVTLYVNLQAGIGQVSLLAED